MPKGLLITGGCGFIGANLIANLAARGGYTVVALDSEAVGKREHIAGLGASFVKGDIRDADLMRKLVPGTDVVVHLAADTRVVESVANPSLNFDVNVAGTFGLLGIMREAGVTRIVNASTGGAIVGDVTPPVHEGMVPRPVSPYGASKLAAEGYLSAFAGSYGFEVTSLRFANVYGPRSWHKGSVVAAFFHRILAGEPLIVFGDGTQTRDLVYVDDIVQGIVAAIDRGVTGVFQLGSGNETSVNHLIDTIREVVGPRWPVEVLHRPPRAGEVARNYCDVSKARSALGYGGDTALRDGLERTWRWFLEHRTAGAKP